MLAPTTLNASILRVIDSSDPGFVGWPIERDENDQVDMQATNLRVGEHWAGALSAYLMQATFPPASALLPLAHPIALAAAAAVIASQLEVPQNGLPAIAAGFAAYAATLSALTIPLMGVITPPPALLILPLPAPGPAAAAAALWAPVIDTWARTGTFITPTVPPVVIPWS